MSLAQHLRSGATITLATKVDQVGEGAGFLYVSNLGLHLAESKPAELDSRFQFIIEKPPQKSGGVPDLAHIYDGDDVLLRSVGNGRYPKYVTNYGGSNAWEVISNEHDTKANYRSEGQGSMEMFRIVAMEPGSQPGAPVLMDGQHSYGLVNVRSVAWLSASLENGIRSAANAGPRESWFVLDHLGEVPRGDCHQTGTPKPASAAGGMPPVLYRPSGAVSSMAMSSQTKKDIGYAVMALVFIALFAAVAFIILKKRGTSTPSFVMTE